MKQFSRTLAAAISLLVVTATRAVAYAPNKGGTLVTVLGSNVRNLNSAVQSGIVTGYPGAQLFASPLRYHDS